MNNESATDASGSNRSSFQTEKDKMPFTPRSLPSRLIGFVFTLGLLVSVTPLPGGNAQAAVQSSYEIKRLGLTSAHGDNYRRESDGEEFAFTRDLNTAGQAVGFSFSYPGNARIAWLDDGTGPTRLGFRGADYQRASDGREFIIPNQINSQGQAIGYSERYDGSNTTGTIAWLDDGNGPTRLGLRGGVYQRTDGYEFSEPLDINNAGTAVGYSNRYNESASTGRAAWLDDGTGPVRLGFHGNGYQRSSDGYEFSFANAINQAGQAVGSSDRYDGTQSTGRVAWIDDGSGPMRIGFSGNIYQRKDGYEYSDVSHVNDAGLAAGYSGRYEEYAFVGSAAWIDDGTGPVRIGLTGNGYRRAGTLRESSNVLFLNNSGQAAGVSSRYDLSISTGQAAWIDDGTGPIQLGFTGSGYQRTSDGYEDSFVRALNDTGQAVGYSQRYDGSSYNGQSGWFYDSETDTNHELVFSTRSDGHAYTDPAVLTDDGTVFGRYDFYNTGEPTETRLFAWSLDDGFIDLNDRVTNLNDDGWDRLFAIIDATDGGLIVGHANVPNGGNGQAAFLLVPEPGVAASGLVALACFRLRRRGDTE